MAAIRSQFLFAYGILRAEEQVAASMDLLGYPQALQRLPELYTLKEGYPILLVEPNIKVVTASYEWDGLGTSLLSSRILFLRMSKTIKH